MEDSRQTYLSIKNWEKYQPRYTNGKRAQWIKSWTNKYDDPEYGRLSPFQRHILDGIRDIRGSTGKNPPNDASYVSNALRLHGTDRPHTGRAIARLISVGFLEVCDARAPHELVTSTSRASHELVTSTSRAPHDSTEVFCNEQNSQTSYGKSRVDKNRIEKKEQKHMPPQKPAAPLHLAFESEKLKITAEEDGLFSKSYPWVKDREAEYRKMSAWLVVNHETRRNHGRFANAWLSRIKEPLGGSVFSYSAQDDPISKIPVLGVSHAK